MIGILRVSAWQIMELQAHTHTSPLLSPSSPSLLIVIVNLEKPVDAEQCVNRYVTSFVFGVVSPEGAAELGLRRMGVFTSRTHGATGWPRAALAAVAGSNN